MNSVTRNIRREMQLQHVSKVNHRGHSRRARVFNTSTTTTCVSHYPGYTCDSHHSEALPRTPLTPHHILTMSPSCALARSSPPTLLPLATLHHGAPGKDAPDGYRHGDYLVSATVSLIFGYESVQSSQEPNVCLEAAAVPVSLRRLASKPTDRRRERHQLAPPHLKGSHAPDTHRLQLLRDLLFLLIN